MITSNIKKVKEVGKKDANAVMTVTLTVPKVSAESKMGTFFKTVNHEIVTEHTVCFTEVKDIMKFHDVRTWKELKAEIEKKYNHYFKNSVQLATVSISNEKDVVTGKKEIRIQVSMAIPEIKGEKNMGVYFRTVKSEIISECTLSFKDMAGVLEFHEAKSWKDLKSILEDKYDKYYRSIYFA